MGAIRWRVTLYGEVDPGVWSFGVVSFSRADEGLVHEVSIDMNSGVCFCLCEWGTMSGLNRQEPTVDEYPCRHARRVLQEAGWLLRTAEREKKVKKR